MEIAAMREHIKVVFEGKIARAFVQNAARAGLDVVNPDHKVQFIRGWAKDKGLLMGLAYEAWDEVASVSPLANDVIVYGPRDSIVSQLLNKYQAKVYAQKRKVGEGEEVGPIPKEAHTQGGSMSALASNHLGEGLTRHLMGDQEEGGRSSLLLLAAKEFNSGEVVYVVEQFGLQKETVAISGIVTAFDELQDLVTIIVAAFGWCINDPQLLPHKQVGLLEHCNSWKDMFEVIVANMPNLHNGMYSFTIHKRFCFTASTIPEDFREQFVSTWMAVQAVASSTANKDTSVEDSRLDKENKAK
eukprot:CAMPEP_0196590626 /NCGR_PEP_ID=MMETSP1081-20130531/67111_1 /TAXON_ID=36882 /ORGANISM="Pyramimonas amylifera, Strain CCMP720" /LENGTH=299 /DNA_ID=CAMNT_0041913777 /DNA_START=69 /DNA_END=968 /DNA_ORIENTATION=+